MTSVHPPLGKTVVSSYPTPEIADAILAVVKDTNVAGYKTEVYGTAHPDEKNYPGYELSLIVPDDAAKTAKWLYVSNRANQENYNYAITYSQNDPDFPIVTRRYVLPRADYTALADGTADTVFTGTVLTSEKTEATTGHPELDALYILVDRVFETLPGQWSESTQLDQDGETITTTSRRRKDADIETVEAIDDGVWTRASKKDTESTYVSEEIVVSRVIPGTAGVPKVEPDVDGATKTTTKTFVELSTVEPGETLADGIWTKTSTEPVTELAGWKVVVTRAIPGTAIPSTSLSKDGDLTSETRTLVAAAGFTATSAIVSGTWTRTYDEPYPGSTLVVWKVVQVRTTANALPFYSVEIPNVIPEKMRAALNLDTTETVVKGTATQPTLSTGDFFRSQQQIDQYTYRLKIVNLSASSATVTDHSITEQYGGGPTTITWTLASSAPTTDTGLLVLSSKVDALGNGLYLKTSEVRDGSEWPTLTDTDVDDTYGFASSSTSQVVAPEDITPGVSGTSITEARKIDEYRSEKIVHTAPTGALDSLVLVFPETVNLDLPPVLTGVTKISDVSSGDGTFTEDTSASITGGVGTWTLTPRASAQSSAAILPDVQIDITTVWGSDIPAISYAFFMSNGTTQANILTRLLSITGQTVHAWPRFKPQAHTIVLKGQRKSVSAQVGYTDHLSQSGPGVFATAVTMGSGISVDAGTSVKIVRIPPTIHGAITFGGSPTLTANLGGTAKITVRGADTNAKQTISDSVTASITPTSFSGTAGDSAIPTTGLYLRRVQTKPYRYGKTLRLMVEAQVVDFSNVG